MDTVERWTPSVLIAAAATATVAAIALEVGGYFLTKNVGPAMRAGLRI